MTWTLLVAGGRDANVDAAVATLDSVIDPSLVSEVVSGAADGWDKAGEVWAAKHGLPVTRFVAEWGRYAFAAGPKRNERMAAYVKAKNGRAFLGPGGRGTADMRRRCEAHNIPIVATLGKAGGA